jgi:adenosylmethionine-8-amino-7-oxononanoate aminotransferase
MMEWETDQFVAADKRFVWHPFTDMRDGALRSMSRWFWSKAWGALLRDSRGREYIDGSSSIWTNIHGHNHPHISAAIRRQLGRVAHTSLLGFTNLVAIELAEAIDAKVAADVIGPLIQGAAGMRLWPPGTYERFANGVV